MQEKASEIQRDFNKFDKELDELYHETALNPLYSLPSGRRLSAKGYLQRGFCK